jgi:23S rRNA (cytidine1920-2'-O)/16S rRNA (cytidine1409-2'-O)-methyltransferase
LLVKPQFEVGKELVGKGGVVRDPDHWTRVLDDVTDAGASLGLGLEDATVSPLKGPAGNVEFFVHLRAGSTDNRAALEEAIAEAAS